MKSFLLLLGLLLIVAGVLVAMSKRMPAKGIGEKPRRKAPLTANEQAMFNRLAQSLPERKVLAQVSFGALLDAKSRTTRNTFDRKMADFVVCDAAFQVLAIVELDDSSHRNKAERDNQRDSMLQAAGYRVVRYPRIPDIDRVQADFPAN